MTIRFGQKVCVGWKRSDYWRAMNALLKITYMYPVAYAYSTHILCVLKGALLSLLAKSFAFKENNT